MNLVQKKKYFCKIFRKAENKYRWSVKRLSAEGWAKDWQMLIAIIMSAQSRDETTIPIAENLFLNYTSLDKLANADYNEVLNIFRSLNYNRTKARNAISAAKHLINHFSGRVPDSLEELIEVPGVGRKTANLVLSEIHNKDSICVDTHVHRISNVLGFVKTKNPTETEFELMKIAPRKYWSRINRIFVLWGKDAPGRDKRKLLQALDR